MILAIVSAKATILSVFWVIVVLASFLAVVSIALGLIFRNAWLWRTAIVLIVTTLVIGAGAAILDHLGYAR